MNFAKILLISCMVIAESFMQNAKCTEIIPVAALSSQHSAPAVTGFIPDTLNFGPVILFGKKVMGFVLKNTGTDTFFVAAYKNSNLGEFSVTGPTKYYLYPDSSQLYTVTFSPQIHQALHTDSVTFTFDDSTNAKLLFFGLDHLPIYDTLAISRDYLVYADSEVIVSQVLTSSLAGLLDSVRFFSEYINFDPNVINIVSVDNGANTPAPDWTINTSPTFLGVIPVTATSTGYALQGPGEILRLHFHVLSTDRTFESSTVWDSAAIFAGDPLEPVFATDTGLVRVIDSCTVQLTNNAKPVSNIEQNFPNPASGVTTIFYSVGTGIHPDSAALQSPIPISILLYDAIGNLVRTLVNADMQLGRHEVQTDVSGLNPGTYWYEFRAGTARQIKLLVVAR